MLLIALVIFTSACSHMPLSTMVSMSSFDEEDFIAINPSEIKVRIRTDKYLDLNDRHIKLQFKLISPSGNLDETLSLNKISTSNRQINQWFGKEYTEYNTIFALSEESIDAFKQFQDSKLVRTARDNADISFNAKVQFPEEAPNQLMFSIDLQLDLNDDYFTLFDEVYVDFEKAAKEQGTQ